MMLAAAAIAAGMWPG